MSVDTKGVVVTPVKDAFFIAQRIASAIEAAVSESRRQRGMNRAEKDDQTKYPSIEMATTSDMLRIHFKLNGDVRMLTVHLDCDCDHRELGQQSLVLSLGCYGQSVELMRLALQSLSALGPCYLDESDSDDKDLELVELAPVMTYVEAVCRRQESGHTYALKRWLQACLALRETSRGAMTLVELPAEQVIGLTDAQVAQIFQDKDNPNDALLETFLEQARQRSSGTKALTA